MKRLILRYMIVVGIALFAISCGVTRSLSDDEYLLSKVEVKAGDVLVEYDKLIDQQLERAAITAISGFAKICDGASAVLNV